MTINYWFDMVPYVMLYFMGYMLVGYLTLKWVIRWHRNSEPMVKWKRYYVCFLWPLWYGGLAVLYIFGLRRMAMFDLQNLLSKDLPDKKEKDETR